MCLNDRLKPGEPSYHGSGPESQCWHSSLLSVGKQEQNLCFEVFLQKLIKQVYSDRVNRPIQTEAVLLLYHDFMVWLTGKEIIQLFICKNYVKSGIEKNH